MVQTQAHPRILLAGSINTADFTVEANRYLVEKFLVVVNTFFHNNHLSDVQNIPFEGSISFVRFDPSEPSELLNAITEHSLGFDAIVCPPTVSGLSESVLTAALNFNGLRHKLRVIGSPNDSLSHLDKIIELAAANGVAVINTPSIHASAVAEYTILQIGYLVRRLHYFNNETGRDGNWPHQDAMLNTQALCGKTIGIIGGSGKDGAAVIKLALSFRMRVVSMGSGSPDGVTRILKLGATAAKNIDDLLSQSDFISINCRKNETTIGMIGTREIALMKPHVIIVNPAGAEIIKKEALIAEFSMPVGNRRIACMIMDMPYGGRRDDQAFTVDPDNARLKALGVVFTPRMAGYTAESHNEGNATLADILIRRLQSNSDAQQDISQSLFGTEHVD